MYTTQKNESEKDLHPPHNRKEKLYQLIGEMVNLFDSDFRDSDIVELEKDRSLREGNVIKEPEDVLPFILFIAKKKQEHFLCISLSAAHEVIGSRIITIGLLNTTQAHPREVFVGAISDRAQSIITAHNHTGGSLKPSQNDITIARQLVDAGKIIGIPMLDHIIITQKGYMSFNERGYL